MNLVGCFFQIPLQGINNVAVKFSAVNPSLKNGQGLFFRHGRPVMSVSGQRLKNICNS